MIDGLSAVDRRDIVPGLNVVTLEAGAPTHAPDAAYDWVVFPMDAILSVVTVVEGGAMAEVGTVGNEGASGVDVAFGAPVLRTTICQVGGRVARMTTAAFLSAVTRNARFDTLVRATEKARVFAIEQMVVCNSVHLLEKRCARWILLMADRVSRDEYPLTHDFLSIMLGVRRASVSKVAQNLHDAGGIAYNRGRVRILSRTVLESLACECYGATARVFDAALDVWGRRVPRERAAARAAGRTTHPAR